MRAIAAVLALFLAVGCTDGAGDVRVPVPEGFQEYRTDQYGFAHPAGWQRKEEKDDRGRPVLTVLGPETSAGVREGHVHVQRYGDYSQEFDTALSQFRGLARMNGYRITASRPVRVAGAAQAHRFEASYDLESDDGQRIPFMLVGLYALTEEKDLLEFMVRSPQQGQAPEKASTIFASFRLRGN